MDVSWIGCCFGVTADEGYADADDKAVRDRRTSDTAVLWMWNNMAVFLDFKGRCVSVVLVGGGAS